MQRPLRPTQMFNRHHMAAIQRCQKPDTGVDRFIDQLTLRQPPHQDRAGPAIALGTALLAPRKPPLKAQEIKQGVARRDRLLADVAVVKPKPDMGARCRCHDGVPSRRSAIVAKA